MSKRNIIIVVTAILAVIIGIGSIFVYKNIKETNELEAFNDYVEGYKVEMSNYLVTQHKDKYDDLVTKSEQLVSNKEIKNIESFKQESIVLKEEIVKANLELINGVIAEIEAIDISKVDDKDSIKVKIDEIEKLRDDNKFIKANEAAIGLKDEINKKLQDIRVTEEKKIEEEKKKAEEEAKKKAEEEAKKLEEENIFSKEKAVEILLENQPFYDKFDINEKDGAFSFAKDGKDVIWIILWEQQYDNNKKLKYYSYRLKDIKMHEDGGTGTIENGYIYEDGTIGY